MPRLLHAAACVTSRIRFDAASPQVFAAPHLPRRLDRGGQQPLPTLACRAAGDAGQPAAARLLCVRVALADISPPAHEELQRLRH